MSGTSYDAGADDQGPDDRALLRAHVAGDPDAFGTLFGRHRDRLWAVALRTTGDPEDAADALQEAMIAAFRRAESFRGDAAVTTWLHRIVVNACLDRLRRRKVRRADPLPDDLEEHPGTLADGARPARPRGPAGRPGTTRPGARRARHPPARPAGGPGAARHGGLPGRGGGRHPGLRAGHREEPLLTGTGSTAAAARRPAEPSGRAARPTPGGHHAHGTPGPHARR